MIEKSVNYLLCELLHNKQNSIRFFVYSVIEEVMLDLLGEEVTGDVLDAHTKNFHTDAAADRLSQMLLTSNIFILPILKFERRKNHSVVEEKKSIVFAPKDPWTL